MASRVARLLRSLAIPLALPVVALGAACGEDDPPPPPPTILNITVLDVATEAPISGAQLVILEQQVVQPAVQALTARVPVAPGANRRTTDASGLISAEILPGRYVLRIDAARYLSSPEPFTPPNVVIVPANVTTDITVRLEPYSGVSGSGSISGVIAQSGVPLAGVLVHAESTASFATLTDVDGVYVLLGLPANLYRVEGLRVGYGAASVSNVDVATSEVIGVDLDLDVDAGATITATIGGSAGTTTVALALASTGDPLPGASSVIVFGAEASITGVPVGAYAVVAGLERDGRVISPDLLRRRTPAAVDVTDASARRVALPIAPVVESLTVDTSSTTPTPHFRWSAYPGATFYVVEVVDLRGRVMWGGLDARGQTLFRVRATDVAFGDLAAPLNALVSGNSYRVRVYAGREVPATGTYELMAGSEPRDGRFRAP